MTESASMHRRVRLDGDPAPVRGLRTMLASFLRDRAVDEKTARAVVLAFSEALDNAMEHGLSSMPGEIVVRLRYAPHFILLSLRDSGSDRTPLGLAFQAGPEEERGRGFALMNELMDNVRVKVFPDGGTRVTLMRRLGRPA